MNRCRRVQALLPLIAAGETEPGRAGLLRLHLDNCAACRTEEVRYLALIAQARQTLAPEYGLPESVVKRVAAEAAEGATERRWVGFPSFGLLARQPALLAALAALVVALVALPLAMRPAGRRGEEALKIKVEAQDGTVRLAWTDGNRESYTVRKATDPRDLARAAAYRVRGNHWVDRDPGSSPVVYYAIE